MPEEGHDETVQNSFEKKLQGQLSLSVGVEQLTDIPIGRTKYTIELFGLIMHRH